MKHLKNWKRLNERQSKIIEHWFFVGLKHEEIAEVLNVSVPTVRRDFRLAKAWLSREMKRYVNINLYNPFRVKTFEVPV
jgi:DNA-directed RNA polymerase specialized sigma24 family protein